MTVYTCHGAKPSLGVTTLQPVGVTGGDGVGTAVGGAVGGGVETCKQQLGVSLAVHPVFVQHPINPLFGLACHPVGQVYVAQVFGASVGAGVGAGVVTTCFAQGLGSVVVFGGAGPSRQQVPWSFLLHCAAMQCKLERSSRGCQPIGHE